MLLVPLVCSHKLLFQGPSPIKKRRHRKVSPFLVSVCDYGLTFVELDIIPFWLTRE